MLILQRKEGESLHIGDDVEITVLAVEAGRVPRRERTAYPLPDSRSLQNTWFLNAYFLPLCFHGIRPGYR